MLTCPISFSQMLIFRVSAISAVRLLGVVHNCTLPPQIYIATLLQQSIRNLNMKNEDHFKRIRSAGSPVSSCNSAEVNQRLAESYMGPSDDEFDQGQEVEIASEVGDAPAAQAPPAHDGEPSGSTDLFQVGQILPNDQAMIDERSIQNAQIYEALQDDLDFMNDGYDPFDRPPNENVPMQVQFVGAQPDEAALVPRGPAIRNLPVRGVNPMSGPYRRVLTQMFCGPPSEDNASISTGVIS